MPTDDHLAWFILGIIAVLIVQVINDAIGSFLRWRSERRSASETGDLNE